MISNIVPNKRIKCPQVSSSKRIDKGAAECFWLLFFVLGVFFSTLSINKASASSSYTYFQRIDIENEKGSEVGYMVKDPIGYEWRTFIIPVMDPEMLRDVKTRAEELKNAGLEVMTRAVEHMDELKDRIKSWGKRIVEIERNAAAGKNLIPQEIEEINILKAHINEAFGVMGELSNAKENAARNLSQQGIDLYAAATASDGKPGGSSPSGGNSGGNGGGGNSGGKGGGGNGSVLGALLGVGLAAGLMGAMLGAMGGGGDDEEIDRKNKNKSDENEEEETIPPLEAQVVKLNDVPCASMGMGNPCF